MIIEKPTSTDDAVTMLQRLSGETHSVLSGLVFLIPPSLETEEPQVFQFCEKTEVIFSSLYDDAIRSYVATGSPMDKSGGYGIQDGMAASFISGINGCYYNVTGFPTNRFCRELIQLIENKHFNL